MNPFLTELIARYPQLDSCIADVQRAFETLCDCYEKDGTVYLCGNGGSAADTEHIVGELMKSFTSHRPVPESETYKIQELHLPIYHTLCRMLEARFFDQPLVRSNPGQKINL